MVLSDRQLKERLPSIITPYQQDRVQPSSYDVALGHSFRVPVYHSVMYVDLDDPPRGLTKEVVLEDDGQVMVHPGDFILAATAERVEVPDDLVCRIEGKSSVGRLGLMVHATAGFVDPGFCGVLTLEMTNLLRVPIILRPGRMIAQLAFQELTSAAEEPYAGKYQGDERATESRYGQEIRRKRRNEDPKYQRAHAEVVDWDEFGQGYGSDAELLICICGAPYPLRNDHVCSYTPSTPEEEQWTGAPE